MLSNPIKQIQDYSEKPSLYFGTIRSEILPVLPDNISKILEVGAGSGATIGYIKEKWHVKKAVAVEPFADAAAECKKHVDLVIDKFIEDLVVDDFKDAPFDLILCLDVLEHLKDPWAAVETLSQLLPIGGRIIASVPNVSHHSSLFPLMFKGKWRLSDDGILDRTHLRFFVKETAVELMASSGLHVVDVRAHCKGRLFFINKITFGVFERFLSIQYFVTVEKKI